MTESDIQIRRWLYPAAWLYRAVTSLRNKLFDRGWLRSRSFDVPTVCIGNLAVGGTGKTPHTEYLIRLLQAQGLHVATLSRGYKRRSRGFQLADAASDATQLGDEPMQMKLKFPQARVSVCEDRCRGVERLLELQEPPVDVILLDDAFQHRYLRAGLNILLTDYHRLLCDDALLPAGTLREAAGGKDRAQIVIVTKCPDDIKPIDFNIVGKKLQLYPFQQLYFSTMRYGPLRPLYGQPPHPWQGDEEVLLLTGIAHPEPMVEYLQPRVGRVVTLRFADHHDFSAADLRQMATLYRGLSPRHRLVVTTEKDATRLLLHPLPDKEMASRCYALPIEIEFLQNQQDMFNQNILSYVKANPRNC